MLNLCRQLGNQLAVPMLACFKFLVLGKPSPAKFANVKTWSLLCNSHPVMSRLLDTFTTTEVLGIGNRPQGLNQLVEGNTMELTIDEIIAKTLSLSIRLDREMRFEESATLSQAVAWIITKRRELDRLQHPVNVDRSLITRELRVIAEFQAEEAKRAIS